METARRNDSLYIAPLLDALHARGYHPETCAADKGYDNTRVYAECEERGCEPVIPLRGAKANQRALPLALGGRLFPRIPGIRNAGATSTVAAQPSREHSET